MRGTLPIIVLTFLLSSCNKNICHNPHVRNTREYISASWTKTVRENSSDNGTLIGLPYPYTVPSPQGMFQELYYWDTFFTNEGLIRDSLISLAKGNVSNMLFLVEKYGFMPNGNRTWYLSRSQPPFLSQMVDAVFKASSDTVWLSQAYPILEREYNFWMSERITACGLNRYSGDMADSSLVEEFIETGSKRLKHDFSESGMTDEELDKLGLDFVAEAESGWDMNPRFDRRCGDFCPVDLNALLYMYELNFARFSTALGMEKHVAKAWEDRAEQRKRMMTELMFDPGSGQFYDYDYVNKKRSDVLSAAEFTVLFAGAATQEQAKTMINGLDRLEFRHGIAVCENRPYEFEYQWSYPNSWPPSTYMTVMGLLRYGFHNEAVSIAGKYVRTVASSFRKTGKIWEKYNVVTGTYSSGEEYDTPEMLGWSAGTFVVLYDFLKDN